MSRFVYSETIHTLEDLEAACGRCRTLTGKDAAVVIDCDFTSDVVMTLREHKISKRFSLNFTRRETG